MTAARGHVCVRDRLYELRRAIRANKLDLIDVYKQLETIAATKCMNECILRRTMRDMKNPKIRK